MGALRTSLVSILLIAVLAAVGVAFGPNPPFAIGSEHTDRPAAGLPANTPSTSSATTPPRTVTTPVRDAAAEQRDLREADAVLARLQKQYRHLEGVTLRIGPTPDDREAVAYYTEGEIVIAPDHTVSIEKILAHEVWHVIDWRDNGRLDWGEDLPPANVAAYRSRY